MKILFRFTITLLLTVLLIVCPFVKCNETDKHGPPTMQIVHITLYVLGTLTVFIVFACAIKYCLCKPNAEPSFQAQFINDEPQTIEASSSTQELREEMRSISDPAASGIGSRPKTIPVTPPTVTATKTYVKTYTLNESQRHIHGKMYEQVHGHIQMEIPEETVEQLGEEEHIRLRRNPNETSEKDSTFEGYEKVWFKPRNEANLLDI